MTSIESLQQIKCLPTTDLTDNDPVGPVSEGGLQQIPNCDCRYPGLLASALKPNQICLTDVQFGGVFDEQNSFFVRNEIGQDIQQRRFTRSGSATDQNVLITCD